MNASDGHAEQHVNGHLQGLPVLGARSVCQVMLVRLCASVFDRMASFWAAAGSTGSESRWGLGPPLWDEGFPALAVVLPHPPMESKSSAVAMHEPAVLVEDHSPQQHGLRSGDGAIGASVSAGAPGAVVHTTAARAIFTKPHQRPPLPAVRRREAVDAVPRPPTFRSARTPVPGRRVPGRARPRCSQSDSCLSLRSDAGEAGLNPATPGSFSGPLASPSASQESHRYLLGCTLDHRIPDGRRCRSCFHAGTT